MDRLERKAANEGWASISVCLGLIWMPRADWLVTAMALDECLMTLASFTR